MPVIFRCAVRPTPSIYREQMTVDLKSKTETVLALKGRHDPAIIHRARVVVDAVAALAIADACVTRFGTSWLGGEL
jgi:chorismate synthase